MKGKEGTHMRKVTEAPRCKLRMNPGFKLYLLLRFLYYVKAVIINHQKTGESLSFTKKWSAALHGKLFFTV